MDKPCVVYREDCPLYQKVGDGMTREEAIHKMEYSKRAYQMLIDEKVQEGVLVGHGINAEWSADTPIIDAYKDMLDACEMAIKALEQEPSGDLISRQAVISTIYDNESDFKNDFAQGFFADRIRDLPPVNPQQKTGFWVGYDKNDITLWNWWDINTCSICGNGGKHYNKFRYCPNCGAKMESEDKG